MAKWFWDWELGRAWKGSKETALEIGRMVKKLLQEAGMVIFCNHETTGNTVTCGNSEDGEFPSELVDLIKEISKKYNECVTWCIQLHMISSIKKEMN